MGIMPTPKEDAIINPALKDNSPRDDDMERAKLTVLQCLKELADIQDFLKNREGDDLNLASQVLLTKLSRDETCCKDQDISHLHATLNGIPVVLKLKQVKFIIVCVHNYN